MRTRAVIYCRVSSDKQVKQGDGLGSQEQRCRAYAKNAGYKILNVFREEGESGGLFERPAMMELLKFLEQNDSNNEEDKIVVIFDDLKRLARDTLVHFGLKQQIYGRNGRVESPNFRFEDTPEGKFIETIIAATGELERGFWTFRTSKGLMYEKHPVHGNILVPNEPFASIYKEAIESYRDGIFPTIEEVLQFVNKKYKEYGLNNRMSQSNAKRMLSDPLYAGYLEFKKWGIEFRKAQHEGFISIETYKAVQKRLTGKTKPWKRKDYSSDFPLRPLVFCAACKTPMTGSWSTGRHGGKFAHYYCRNTTCAYVWKTTKKKTFEDDFKYYLKTKKPREETLDLAQAVLLEQWEKKVEGYSQNRMSQQSRLEEVSQRIKNYLERIGKATSEDIIEEYEEQIKTLRKEKNDLLEQTQQTNPYTSEAFGTASKKIIATLKNPVRMWQSDEYNDKRTILLMYFDDKLKYDRNLGFGTLNEDCPINVIASLVDSKNRNVGALSNGWNTLFESLFRVYEKLKKLELQYYPEEGSHNG